MRTELLALLVVALVAFVGLMQIEFSGMVVAEPNLAYYPYMFGPDFDAAIIKGRMRFPEELAAANLIISRLPEQYELLKQALYKQGIEQDSVFAQDLQYKIFTEDDVDYRVTDAVMIGSLCHNTAIAKLLDVIDCITYFQPGEGMVKYVESNDHKYVVITGYSGDEVLSAAVYFLSELQLRKIQGNELRIDSTTKVPLRDPRWYGEYTTSSNFRDTRTIQGVSLVKLGEGFRLG
ncbi:hypothetical protein KY310_00630 [Candidatus Woesearchaeota archaeon]|nr:hypothetical protein [Candidatus Woesearchaeota archaeon]